jgi:hypothetical protein
MICREDALHPPCCCLTDECGRRPIGIRWYGSGAKPLPDAGTRRYAEGGTRRQELRAGTRLSQLVVSLETPSHRWAGFPGCQRSRYCAWASTWGLVGKKVLPFPKRGFNRPSMVMDKPMMGQARKQQGAPGHDPPSSGERVIEEEGREIRAARPKWYKGVDGHHEAQVGARLQRKLPVTPADPTPTPIRWSICLTVTSLRR